MINVFYGENHSLSRATLNEVIDLAKNKGKEILRLEGKSLSITDLALALESESLFKSDRLVVIENLFGLAKSIQKDELLKYLARNLDKEILIWEEKDLSPTILKSYSNGFNFKKFKLPAFIFNFLDQLAPDKKNANLNNYHQCLTHGDSQMIFLMLVRQIRLLILAFEGEKFLSSLAPWQRSKIIKQSKKFSLEKLKKIYKKLLEIDFQQKTSITPFDLASTLDLLITEI